MTKKEAAGIIETMMGALRSDPSQFHLDVTVIGQSVSSSGGIGMQVSATGGQAGSTTIGQVVSVDGSQVEIAQSAASAAMDQQVQVLLTSMQTLVDELEAAPPNSGKARSVIESLKETWVPAIITSVLANVISASMVP